MQVLGLNGGSLFNGDDRQTVTAFRDQTGATFPILLGDDTYSRYAAPDGRISPFPVDVIVDREGTIRYLRHEYDGAAMSAVIERLLNE